MTQQKTTEQIYDEATSFRDSFETLLMATSNSAGLPEASYAGYIEEEGDYYVYTSELAKHTGNLQENPNCSIMFIENETTASHLLARKRLIYRCEASEVDRDTSIFSSVFEQLVSRFGFVMNNLKEMSDFHLFRLRPTSGSYVAGFAKAYTFTGDDLKTVNHRNEAGHRKVASESKTA